MMMSFVMPLLSAMVRLDAEALVMAAGRVPRVAGVGGRSGVDGCRDVGAAPTSPEELFAVLKDLLPIELQLAFDDVGAIKFALPELEGVPGHRFTIVASMEGTLEVEIRRNRSEEALQVPRPNELWPGDAAPGTASLL